MQVKLFDRAGYRVTKREYTDEGFLKAPARVARVGIQQYLAKELGIADRNPNEIINVYRPADEVFDAESLATYVGKDVTNDHPSTMVSADNYKQLTVGHVASAGRQDGDFVVVDLFVKDAETIKLVEKGKVELSAGYVAEYAEEKGVFDGVEYEFVQRGIRINHVALVERARAGAQARLFDGVIKEGAMPQITLDSGKRIEVADEAVAALLQDTLDRAAEKVEKLTADMEAEKAKAEKLEAEKDAMEEEMKKKEQETGDEALAERVKSVVSATSDAAVVAGADFTCDSYDEVEIKRAALAKVRDSVEWAEKSAAYVEAAFDMALESAKEKAKNTADADASKQKLAQDMAANVTDNKVAPAQAFKDGLNQAWKKTVGVA